MIGRTRLDAMRGDKERKREAYSLYGERLSDAGNEAVRQTRKSYTRYFIGYLIRGEAAEWQCTLARVISEKFNTEKIYERIPPHITIFRPFDAEDVSPIKDLLREWTTNHSVPGSFVLSGFGHFDDTAVFAKVAGEKSVTDAVGDLQKQLHALPGMPKEEYPRWHPHATLVNHAGTSEIIVIRQYVSTLPKPHFILPFDNVTLFCRDEVKVWRADEIFSLLKSDDDAP